MVINFDLLLHINAEHSTKSIPSQVQSWILFPIGKLYKRAFILGRYEIR